MPVLGAAALLFGMASAARAQDAPPARPTMGANRWQEDWSVLADPSLRTNPFDSLKYLPLSSSNPHSYISLGLNLRERFEANDAPNFGVGHTRGDAYLLQRFQFHIDTRLDENWQIFTQFEDVRAFGKRSIGPTDQNPLDLRLAYVAYVNSFAAGTFKARVGRQDFLFDLERFVSSRDGPNVRQSFDAVWFDWESEPWRFIGFVSQPVQYRDARPFDDTSNGRFQFHTLRVERHVLGTNELSAYYSCYGREGVRFLDATGTESRTCSTSASPGVPTGSIGTWRRWAKPAP